MCIYLVSVEKIMHGCMAICTLACLTLVNLYPNGVAYPSPSGWEITHIGSTCLIHINKSADVSANQHV